MVIKEYENAHDFLSDCEEIMLKRESVSQLILYNAYQNLTKEATGKCFFGAVLNEDKAVLLFCNVIPYNLAVYVNEEDSNKDRVIVASQILADYILSSHIPFHGINARHDVCVNFIEQYKKSVNSTFQEKLAMDIMEIRQVNDLKPTEGNHRLANLSEVKQITDWMIQFNFDALATEIDYEAALNKATRLIKDNKIYVYENPEKQMVTMAIAARKLVHGMAISYVYTPEEYRGQGYAAANIYYMSKFYLEAGNEFCSLFVDKNNPISSRAYEKIGYVTLEDNYDYRILEQI